MKPRIAEMSGIEHSIVRGGMQWVARAEYRRVKIDNGVKVGTKIVARRLVRLRAA